MLNITFISGPPGSGKTYTANLMAASCHADRVLKLNYQDYKKAFNFIQRDAFLFFDCIIIDDCHENVKFITEFEWLYNTYSNDYSVELQFGNKNGWMEKSNLHLIIISQKRLKGIAPYMGLNHNARKVKELILTNAFNSPK